MVLRLLFNLLNNPQMIEKLSESRLVRRAAQITAFAVMKAQLSGKEAAQRVLRSDTVRQIRQEAASGAGGGQLGHRLQRVRNSFIRELRNGMQEAKRQIKKGDSK
ncbi:protein NCBP2AS2 [Pelobates fuscus]|uniref:protein NCBP2AS2 n=1 Tax=Pelobates fuscus TaxID=191477 RepID=UPI002FE4925C